MYHQRNWLGGLAIIAWSTMTARFISLRVLLKSKMGGWEMKHHRRLNKPNQKEESVAMWVAVIFTVVVVVVAVNLVGG